MPRNWSWGKKRDSGYRSGLEESVAATLSGKGVGFKYESVVLSYTNKVRRGLCSACGSKLVVVRKNYTPDFVLDNGRIIEVKGRLTASDRAKLLAVRACNPDAVLVLYFGADNKLRKNSDKRYSDWATQHEFDYAINTIPRRWLRKKV